MVFITADRYNVIVKGVSAEPLTSGGSMMRIAGTWAASLAWCLSFLLSDGTAMCLRAVAAHEKGMREQAKKMGVKSLRSEEAQKTSAECRLCKANAVYNPIVYAISHPKYRAALEKKLPCLACATEGRDGGSDTGSTATAQSTEKAESA
ncbi:rhodopsin [Penaeus vannamei]|uniref:Rhodopsin n=1 Tax=Penaeus vannamei TaxID=6689 RepID=A0A423SQV2_PENVA|nr:rhodopsin [Penaeus vannamei]